MCDWKSFGKQIRLDKNNIPIWSGSIGSSNLSSSISKDLGAVHHVNQIKSSVSKVIGPNWSAAAAEEAVRLN